MSVLRAFLFKNRSQRLSPHRPSFSLSARSRLLLSGKRDIGLLGDDGVLAVSLRELYSLSSALAEVVELCTSAFPAPCGLYVSYGRRMEGEDSFDAFVCDDSSDGKHFAHAAAFSCDDGAGEDLRPDLVAFLDFAVNVNAVANLEMGHVGLEAFILDGVEQVGFTYCLGLCFLCHIFVPCPVSFGCEKRHQSFCRRR